MPNVNKTEIRGTIKEMQKEAEYQKEERSGREEVGNKQVKRLKKKVG